jgi:hypothetical protein
MRSLFPEMEREIASDRLAERREMTQRAREYLRDKHGFEEFITKRLQESGPEVDANLGLFMAELCEVGHGHATLTVILVADAMWRVGKLWRKEIKTHPSGVTCYLYGIRGLHTL